MDVYWTAIVVAFTFKVRVVVVTRTTAPAREDTPENEITVVKGNNEKLYRVTYDHCTNIFDFPDDFEAQKDTYVPITTSTENIPLHLRYLYASTGTCGKMCC